MKLLISSDWHLDATTAGVRRVDEFDRYFDELIDYIEKWSVDLVLVGGDYFDPGHMRTHGLTARLLGYATRINQLTESVWIAGNHDVIETSEGYTTISPLTELAEALGLAGHRRMTVAELPTLIRAKVDVLALPYVAQSVDRATLQTATDQAFMESQESGTLIVIAHMTVPGARMGNESAEMSRGRDYDFPFDRVAALKPAAVFNGHYHVPQVVEHPSGLKIHIPGSPLRLTFGDNDPGHRGFLVAEV